MYYMLLMFPAAYKIFESLQSSALQNCLPLRTLTLSGCALTDASGSVVATIVKVSHQLENFNVDNSRLIQYLKTNSFSWRLACGMGEM